MPTKAPFVIEASYLGGLNLAKDTAIYRIFGGHLRTDGSGFAFDEGRRDITKTYARVGNSAWAVARLRAIPGVRVRISGPPL